MNGIPATARQALYGGRKALTEDERMMRYPNHSYWQRRAQEAANRGAELMGDEWWEKAVYAIPARWFEGHPWMIVAWAYRRMVEAWQNDVSLSPETLAQIGMYKAKVPEADKRLL